MTENAQTIHEHVRALVRVVLWSLGFVISASILVYWQRELVIDFLLQPLGENAMPLQFLAPLDPLFFLLKVCFTLGFLLGLPLIMLLVWHFIAPATRAGIAKGLVIVTATSVLAISAAAYAYTLVVPIVLNYMASIVIAGTTTAFTAHGYLNFLLTTTTLLVMIFQLPLVIVGATSLGLIETRQITSRRRYLYLGTLIATAVITPTTDVITLALVSLPTIVVIELGIFISWLLQPRTKTPVS